MHDSIEADLVAACRLPFVREEEPWIRAYSAAAARLDPQAEPGRVVGAAIAAWQTHGWAHPAVVAQLEHLLGPLAQE